MDEPCVEGAGYVPGVDHADEEDDPPHDKRGQGSPAEGMVEFPVQEFPDPPSQDDPEHPDVHGGGDGGGERQSSVLQRKHQRDAEDGVDDQRDDRGLHGGLRVLEGIEGGDDDPDDGEGPEADGVAEEGLRREQGGLNAEFAPLEENGDDRNPKRDQGDRRRDRDEEDDPEREGDRPFQFVEPPLRDLLGEAGERRRPNGDGEHPEGELDDPVGVVEVGDAPGRQQRGQDRSDEDVDLVDRRPERCGEHQEADPPHPGMAETEVRFQTHPHSDEKGPLHGELEHAARHDADGERGDRLPEKAAKGQRA